MPGPMQLLVIALVIVFLFGAKKLPEFARALRQSVDEFKKPSEAEKANTANNASNQNKDAEIKDLEKKLENLKKQEG